MSEFILNKPYVRRDGSTARPNLTIIKQGRQAVRTMGDYDYIGILAPTGTTPEGEVIETFFPQRAAPVGRVTVGRSKYRPHQGEQEKARRLA